MPITGKEMDKVTKAERKLSGRCINCGLDPQPGWNLVDNTCFHCNRSHASPPQVRLYAVNHPEKLYRNMG